VNVAMWSGPRNVSTALMRSFDSRADTAVCDEPLYAHYLQVTQKPHPGAAAIIEAGEPDWRPVAGWLTGPPPGGRAHFFQKHMAHHLLPVIERGWLADLRHAFLIRDPREMIPSLLKVVPWAGLEDTGLPQQVEIFEAHARLGRTPPVVDSADLLDDPPGVLAGLCAGLDIAYDPAMLTWAPGPRETDGVWAKDWYGAVEASAGWRPRRARPAPLPAGAEGLLAACMPLYERLWERRIRGR